MNQATLVKIREAVFYGSYNETAIYFDRDVFKYFMPLPDAKTRQAILCEIARQWHHEVKSRNKSNKGIIARIRPTQDKNKYHIIYSSGVERIGYEVMQIAYPALRDKVEVSIEHGVNVPLEEVIGLPGNAQGNTRTAIANRKRVVDDFNASFSQYLQQHDARQRKVSGKLIEPPLGDDPETPSRPVAITADNWNTEDSLRILDERFAALSVKPSEIQAETLAIRKEISEQANEAQREFKEAGSQEVTIAIIDRALHDRRLKHFQPNYDDYTAARTRYGKLKIGVQTLLGQDLKQAMQDCLDREETLNDALTFYNFGNDVDTLRYVKRRIAHAIYMAGRDYYKDIWKEAGRISSDEKRVEFLKDKLDQFNEKFRPFIMVDEDYRLSPISTAYRFENAELYELEKFIQEARARCNTSTGWSSRATLNFYNRLNTVRNELREELGEDYFTLDKPILGTKLEKYSKTAFSFTKASQKLHDANNRTREAVFTVRQVIPVSSSALPKLVTQLHETKETLERVRGKIAAYNKILSDKLSVDQAYANIAKSIQNNTFLDDVRNLNTQISTAEWIRQSEKDAITNELAEKVRYYNQQRIAYRELIADTAALKVRLDGILSFDEGHVISPKEALQACALMNAIYEKLANARQVQGSIQALNISSLTHTFDKYEEIRTLERSYANAVNIPEEINTASIDANHDTITVTLDMINQKQAQPNRHEDSPAEVALKNAVYRKKIDAHNKIYDKFHDDNAILLCHLAVSSLLNLKYWQKATNFTQERRSVVMTGDNGKSKTYKVPPVVAGLIDVALNQQDWQHDANAAKALLKTIQNTGIALHDENFDIIGTQSLKNAVRHLPLPQNNQQTKYAIRHSAASLSRYQVKPVKKPGFFKRHWKAMLLGGLLVAGAVAITIGTAGLGAPIAAGLVTAAAAVGLTVSTAVATGVGVGAAVTAGAAVGVATGAAVGAVNDYREKRRIRRQGYQRLEEEQQPNADDANDFAADIEEIEAGIAEIECGLNARVTSNPIQIPQTQSTSPASSVASDVASPRQASGEQERFVEIEHQHGASLAQSYAQSQKLFGKVTATRLTQAHLSEISDIIAWVKEARRPERAVKALTELKKAIEVNSSIQITEGSTDNLHFAANLYHQYRENKDFQAYRQNLHASTASLSL